MADNTKRKPRTGRKFGVLSEDGLFETLEADSIREARDEAEASGSALVRKSGANQTLSLWEHQGDIAITLPTAPDPIFTWTL